MAVLETAETCESAFSWLTFMYKNNNHHHHHNNLKEMEVGGKGRGKWEEEGEEA